MKLKVINTAFVFLFMAMLLTPMAFVNLSRDGVFSRQENRKLAARPEINAKNMFGNPVNFIKQLDVWFTDNIGFRKQFIKLYKKINMLDILGRYLDGPSLVLFGQQGHHFHTHYNQTLPIFQGKRWLTDETSHKLSMSLNEIKKYLDKRGIIFIVLLCVDKESIYGEYYPKGVIRGSEPNSLDVLTQYLNEHTSVDLFNIREALLAEKENYLLFPKTGDIYELCHYNKTGSFFAYRELMKHINAYFPDLKPYSIDDVNIIYRKNGSSSVSLKEKPKYKKIEPRFFNTGDVLEFENNDLNLPTILLMHDSYADSIWQRYLSEHFSRTIFCHWRSFNYFEEYINLYKPNIVVFETAERGIPTFYNYITDYRSSN